MYRFSNIRNNKVAALSSISEVEGNSPNTPNTLDDTAAKVGANLEIAREKITKLFKADQRCQIYKDILLNQPTIEAPYYVALYGFVGIILSCLLTSTILLIPVHNVIEEPEYWYVGMIGQSTDQITFVRDCFCTILLHKPLISKSKI